MYTSIEFISQIPCPSSKGVSYTNLVFGLTLALKLDYYYYYRVNHILN